MDRWTKVGGGKKYGKLREKGKESLFHCVESRRREKEDIILVGRKRGKGEQGLIGDFR